MTIPVQRIRQHYLETKGKTSLLAYQYLGELLDVVEHQDETTLSKIQVIVSLLETIQNFVDAYPDVNGRCQYCDDTEHYDDCPLNTGKRMLKEYAEYIEPEYDGPTLEDLS